MGSLFALTSEARFRGVRMTTGVGVSVVEILVYVGAGRIDRNVYA